MPKGDGNKITATTNELPYLFAVKKVGNPLGLEPVTVDFALKHGVWVKGRVTDKSTGKPLWANLQYFCFDDNPNAKEITFIDPFYNRYSSQEDGLFQIPALPGRGLIAVRALHNHYLMGVGAEQIKERDPRRPPGMFSTVPYRCVADNVHALVEIAPKPGEESIACNVTLDPGRTLTGGMVKGPDGEPLAGARLSGQNDAADWRNDPLPGAGFAVENLKPNKPRVLQFVHDGKKLSGYLIVGGDEKGAPRVQLKPWATLTGRVVTPLGKPLTSVRVFCWGNVDRDGQTLYAAGFIVWPDKNGRFRIEGLAAGLKYELSVNKANVQENISGGNPKDLTLKAGETKDVGDLQVKLMK